MQAIYNPITGTYTMKCTPEEASFIGSVAYCAYPVPMYRMFNVLPEQILRPLLEANSSEHPLTFHHSPVTHRIFQVDTGDTWTDEEWSVVEGQIDDLVRRYGH